MPATPVTTPSAKRSNSKGLSLAIALALAGVPAGAAAQGQAIARGAYLAAAAGCDQCHTDSEHEGKPYAGGRQLGTPFGVIPTPNITPDRTIRTTSRISRSRSTIG